MEHEKILILVHGRKRTNATLLSNCCVLFCFLRLVFILFSFRTSFCEFSLILYGHAYQAEGGSAERSGWLWMSVLVFSIRCSVCRFCFVVVGAVGAVAVGVVDVVVVVVVVVVGGSGGGGGGGGYGVCC